MSETGKTTAGWPRWARCLAFGLCLLPPIVLAILLWHSAVNVPYWDEWDDDIAGLFVKFSDGHLTFGDLWAQHNESRLVLPRLIFLGLGKFTHWNLCYEMGFTFLLACVATGAVFGLGRKAFADRPAAFWTAFFISSLLIFSPAQYEAWLWGMELILYLPLVCILISLLLWQTALAERTKIILSAGLAMISTYSFSNGLLIWIVLFPLFFLSDGWAGLRKKGWVPLGWMLGFFGNVALYVYDYRFPPSRGVWHLLWPNPWPACEYLFTFLGGSLVDHNATNAVGMATATGGTLLSLFVVTVCLAFRWRKNSMLMAAMLPWLTLGGYGLLSGLLATVGRVSLGAEQAMSPRYAIFGICLIVALVYLVPLLAFHQPQAGTTSGQATSATIRLLVTLGTTIILLHALALPSAVINLSVFRMDMLHAKSCLKFLNVLPPQPATTAILHPDFPKLKRMADALDQRGWFDYPLLHARQLSGFKQNPLPDQPIGIIENCQITGTNWLLYGWALSPTHRAPADCILLSCESTGVEPAFFALMNQRLTRPDLIQQKNDPAYLLAGWKIAGRLADLPKGSLTIKIWAYDVENDSVTPLANELHLENK